MTTPRYALAHGREWIAPPRRGIAPDVLAMVPRVEGEPTWLPGLQRTDSPDEAWVTGCLAVALERQQLLWNLQALSVQVRAIP